MAQWLSELSELLYNYYNYLNLPLALFLFQAFGCTVTQAHRIIESRAILIDAN